MRLEKCSCKVPGKVILFGEHWVVHGGRAIAAAIGLYARAVAYVEEGMEGPIVCSRELNVCENLGSSCSMLCNISQGFSLLRAYCSVPRSIRVSIASELPPGSGLGSSAAVAVASLASVACLAGCFDEELVWKASFEAEKLVHGNPSGVDNTVSLKGGFLLYRRGLGAKAIDANIPDDVVLVIVDTGIPRSTRVAVEKFARRLRDSGKIGDELFEAAESIIDEAVESLARGDVARLGMLMDIAHGLLNAMGVSCREIENVVFKLRELGAYGAKLTGAGLGGSVIALFDRDRAAKVVSELQRNGMRVFRAGMGVKGLECSK